ncbi:hypothetical protein VTP01DRAFT_10755 [Rhizomucor pusillus]|uniref:uncharacterized protein n=1 Tax=Rhizomucor pusillus TaxID=4840 RepID=UPI0037423A3D
MTASFGAHLREADILIHCQESNYMSRVKFKPGNLICGVYPLILAFVSCSIASRCYNDYAISRAVLLRLHRYCRFAKQFVGEADELVTIPMAALITYFFGCKLCCSWQSFIVPILTHKEKDRKCYAAFPAKNEC